MSNRIISILIIILAILWSFWFYLYYFVYYTWNVKINWDIDNYSIELTPKEAWFVNINYNCTKDPCFINEVPPTDYKIRIFKEWYKDVIKDISIIKNNTIEIDLKLEKVVLLNQIEEKEVELSNIEKINLIRKESIYYSYLDLKDFWEFYFKEEWLNLWLYKNDKKIWNFKKIDSKENTSIKQIYWSDNYIFLNIWKEKILFNTNTFKDFKIDLNLNVQYIKTWLNNNFIFVTDKWSFIYKIKDNSIEYFSYFNDFIYYKDWYIWIIKQNDNVRKKNLWLEENNKNIVLYYNPETKDRKILYSLDNNIKKILLDKGEIIFIDSENKKYSLENVE